MLSVLYSSFFSTKDKISSKKTKSTKKLFWLCFNSLMHVRRIQLRSRPASIEAAVFYLYTQASWYDCYTLYKLYSVIQQCNILCTFCTLYIVHFVGRIRLQLCYSNKWTRRPTKWEIWTLLKLIFVYITKLCLFYTLLTIYDIIFQAAHNIRGVMFRSAQHFVYLFQLHFIRLSCEIYSF